jgi:hypothetical protein
VQQLYLWSGLKQVKKRLIIHIGMHKTGSTTLQRFLSRNRLLLRLFGINYPLSRDETGRRQSKHNAIFTAISHEADRGLPHPALGPSERLIENLGDQIDRAGCRINILSAEGFSGERPIFADAFAPFADRYDVRIVVFLRRYDHWVESFYKQMVMSREVRETRSFADFLAAPSTQAHLRYSRILGWWADIFGDDALRVCGFDPGSEAQGPVRTFLKAADLPHRLAWLGHSRSHLNRSPSQEEVEARRQENLGGEPGKAKIQSKIALQSEKSPLGYFTATERESFLSDQLDDLVSIKSRFDCMGAALPFMMHEKTNDANAWSRVESCKA